MNLLSFFCITYIPLASLNDEKQRDYSVSIQIDAIPKIRNAFWKQFKDLVLPTRERYQGYLEIEFVSLNESFSGCNDLKKKECEEKLMPIYSSYLGMVDLLTRSTRSTEAQLFFWELKADIHRYIIEISTGEQREKETKEAFRAYSTAFKLSEQLDIESQERYEIGYNFSVFFVAVLDDRKGALDFIDLVLRDTRTSSFNRSFDLNGTLLQLEQRHSYLMNRLGL